MTEKQNKNYINALLDGLIPGQPASPDELATAYELCGFSRENARRRPLAAILGKVGGKNTEYVFQPGALSLDEEGVFAKTGVQENLSDWEKEVTEGWNTFQKAFSGSGGYAYSLYHFLHAYGARISYGAASEAADASLFDRNRVLAAVTSCLSYNNGEARFLILKGAIGGIQKYIYHNIGAEQIGDADKTSKRLRGRSFLVAFINQVIAESIVESLGLEQANILFVGGGHFTLLLPDNEKLVNQLNASLKQINLGMLENIGPQLSLITAWERCEGNIGEQFAEQYRKVHGKLEVQKQRRYQSYLTEVFAHIEQLDEAAESKQESEEEELGRLAPYAKFILEVQGGEEALQALRGDASGENHAPAITAFSFLGKHFYIIKDEVVDEEAEQELRTRLIRFLNTHSKELKGCNRLKIIALNNPDILSSIAAFQNTGLDLSYGFHFVGNHAPVYKDASLFQPPAEKGNVMLFEDLAKLNENGEPRLAYEQLGVMRLDVDDLGAIFAHGLDKGGQQASMERLLCLSREFQLFFGGYFNLMAKENYMYVTYSGGDDAFVIGSWLNALRFGETLRGEFGRFNCGNDNVSFSAGILLCNPHYPIPRLAKDGAAMEKRAKEFLGDGEERFEREKNALHVFEHTLRWKEFKTVMDFEKKLSVVLPEGEGAAAHKIRRSMLRRFLRIIQTSKNEPFERYRHIAALHGLLARHGYGHNTIENERARLDEAGELIKELLQKASNQSTEGQREFDHYTIPLHIALYKTKSK